MIEEKLNTLIYEVRNKKVVLVRDLARLYEIETRILNQTIKRNIVLFNNEDYFQMSNQEFDDWKSQFVISKSDKTGLRTLPFVLTKEGILILSKLIKKENINLINSQLLKEFDDEILTKNELVNYQFLPENRGKIEDLIYEVRGVQVMLDSDLALLYGCKNGTKEINQAVKNNIEKFPSRYSWVLNEEDILNLRSKFLTSSLENNYGGRRYKIRVFTEQGTAMLATIIKSDIATKTSMQIMDAFVNMRHFFFDYKILLESNLNILNRLDNQDRRNIGYDKNFEMIFSKFKNNEEKEMIFFDGQIYDAFSKILDILSLAKKELTIIDPYADKKILDMISNVKVKVILITMKERNLKQSSIDNYNKQYDNLNVINDYSFHDRYIIIDKEIIYHFGASLTGAGKKTFSIDKYEEPDVIKLLLDKVEKIINKK